MEGFVALIWEVGLENRLFILEKLKDHPMTISVIKKELKERGIHKPFSTISRNLKSLEERNLVCEVEKDYHLTLKGRILLKGLEELKNNLSGFEEIDKIIQKYPIYYLPDDLLEGAHLLSKARLVEDPFNVMWDSVKAVGSAEKEVLAINTDILNREFGILAVNKCLEGLKLRSVVYENTLDDRINMLYEIIREKGINESGVATLKENFTFRSIDEEAMNLLVTDNLAAGISLPDQRLKNKLTPAFRSDDPEFIEFVKDIFNWFWKRGREVAW